MKNYQYWAPIFQIYLIQLSYHAPHARRTGYEAFASKVLWRSLESCYDLELLDLSPSEYDGVSMKVFVLEARVCCLCLLDV